MLCVLFEGWFDVYCLHCIVCTVPLDFLPAVVDQQEIYPSCNTVPVRNHVIKLKYCHFLFFLSCITHCELASSTTNFLLTDFTIGLKMKNTAEER